MHAVWRDLCTEHNVAVASDAPSSSGPGPCTCRAHPQEEQQQAAAAAVAGSSKQQRQQQQVPSPAQVAEHLYNNHLIDVPKMLDIAVLYGPGNSKLTGQLLQQLLVLQPKYAKVLRFVLVACNPAGCV